MKNFKIFIGNLNNRKVTGLLWEDNKNEKSLVIYLNKKTNHWMYEGFSDDKGSISGEIPDDIMISSVDNKKNLHVFLKNLFD